MNRELGAIAKKLARGKSPGYLAEDISARIRAGEDPIGEHFCAAVSADSRRSQGVTLTPQWMVDMMIDRVDARTTPVRVVDPGAGTGRFAMAAARKWPSAEVIAIEKDPDLANSIRLNAKAAGLAVRTICGDYLKVSLPKIDGVTAFIGNPPYVRHHDIPGPAKSWYSKNMADLGCHASQLAGLHLYFFLRTHQLSSSGDIGCFITAAEWTETSYGAGMRSLFCQMGGAELVRVDPAKLVFEDALTTSIISTWNEGATTSDVTILDLKDRIPTEGFATPKESLATASRWPRFGQQYLEGISTGPVLGDLFRVTRGQVTGMNSVWIANEETEPLIPSRYLFPCVTHAVELIKSGSVLRKGAHLHKVIDLPANLDEMNKLERGLVSQFLGRAMDRGAHLSYVASHRQQWWKVGLKTPPPVIMTYMGRRAPVFVRNLAGARVINIAHALYPRVEIPDRQITRIVHWLNRNVQMTAGRVYGGGLVKFEPKEAMRIGIPNPRVFDAA